MAAAIGDRRFVDVLERLGIVAREADEQIRRQLRAERSRGA